MTDSDSRLVELEREIKACRRSAHRDRWIAGGLAALVMILMLGGAGAPGQGVIDTLWVKHLYVYGAKGPRMVMEVDAKGSATLAMLDVKGKSVRMLLDVGADDDTILSLFDGKGIRMGMQVGDKGGAGMSMFDTNNNRRLGMVVDNAGKAGMAVIDEGGKALWNAP